MASNVGQQQISVKYHDPVNSDVVNQRFFDIRPVGISKGGYVTYPKSSNVISISPLVCEIKDRGADRNQIRMETTATVSKTLSDTGKTYIVLRWDHELDASTDYVTIDAVTSPEETDIVIGKVTFTGSNISGFSYEQRTFANDRGSFLKVTPIYPTASTTLVRVMQGLIMTSTAAGYILVDEQTVDLSFVSGTPVYVYVQASASTEYDAGTVLATSTKSTAVRNILLAKVTKDGSTITEKDIQDLRGFLTGPILVDNATVMKNINNQLKVVDNVYVKRTGDEDIAGTKTFYSSPLVPTAAAGDSSTKAASTAFVQAAKQFGNWATTGTLLSGASAALAIDTVFVAQTDGFVLAYGGVRGGIGYTDSSDSPTTIRAYNVSGQAISTIKWNIMFPVKKNDRWKISKTASDGTVDAIYWMPVGS